ncbi:GntR family transcriptional regulator [Emergencia sp.]|uniref:GntR family transcriptional regulator n=1 Tax=Emergencia sp. TaxID=1926557 RepID=UPI003AF0078B
MLQLNKVSMRTQVYEIIKQKILSQEYDWGDQIRILPLCKELGVSNTPVREALSLLEMEGLVTSSLNSRVKVVEMTESLGNEMNQIFLVLISGSYQLCVVKNITSKLRIMLEKALEKQQKSLDKDIATSIHAALAFDRCFVDVIGNEKLSRAFEEQYTLLFLLARYNYQKAALNREDNIKEHVQILDAIRACEHELVHQLLIQHFDKHVD